MRGFWARLLAVGMAGFAALTLATLTFATLGASSASASSRVHGISTQVSGLKVSIYSQMCDHGGPLHTRLVVQNRSSKTSSIVVHDAFAHAGYDPPGPIEPGKSMLVHLISSKITPSHTLTVAADGEIKTMTVPQSPCPPVTTIPSSSSSSSSSSTTSTTGSSTSSTITVPVDPGGHGGGPVVGPGVVSMGPSVAGTGAVGAAHTGTLPFTGSDIRLFALLGNLMVLIGFAMLFLSHRSPKAAAFFKRLRPTSST
ncbi:MAG: hypothetical protein ACXWAY_01050 [Acidimicrobiia bacterium]